MDIGFVVNPSKSEYFRGIGELADWLADQGHTVYVEDQDELPDLGAARPKSREEIGQMSDVVAVFGGDGTLLDASHEMVRFDTPILGVNTGGLGFMTETTMDEVRSSFERILSGDHDMHQRMMLEASAPGHEGSLRALNDMVLSRFRLGRVFQVAAYVDDSFVTSYVCDGMIVSTPTGSTAYNLSASGPIVQPDVESIILNPICPHTLTNRPLIVPPSSTVRLSIGSEDRCVLTADGQDKMTELGEGDEISIWKSDRKATLISSGERDFYNILRTKLHWSGRAPEDQNNSPETP
jgi:NAD+ kinase